MASQDLIFPLLPRNTTVAVESGLDKVTRLQKKQAIKGIASDEDGDDTQQARIQEREKRREQQRQQQKQAAKQGKALEQDSVEEHEFDPDSSKGQNLDTFA